MFVILCHHLDANFYRPKERKKKPVPRMGLKDSSSEEQAFSEAVFIVENHSLRACSLSVRELDDER